jgi:hypothetical protein
MAKPKRLRSTLGPFELAQTIDRKSDNVCGNELMLGIDSRNHERIQASFNGRKSRISTAEPVILIVSDWLILYP